MYCGSSSRVKDVYKQAAVTLGRLLAEHHYRLVYGGGRVGLMGLVADAALAAGGEVIGVIPGHIVEKEVAHEALLSQESLFIVDTMHERKQMMVDRSDAFLILPGGLGTMDEFFEIFTWWQLGLHEKPIIIVNVDGYWTPLLQMIDNIVASGFAREDDRAYLHVIDSVEEVPALLEKMPGSRSNVKTKWM